MKSFWPQSMRLKQKGQGEGIEHKGKGHDS